MSAEPAGPIEPNSGPPSESDQSSESVKAATKLAALTDVQTPWAIRVAVTLGLPDAMSGAPVALADLAERVDADEAALARLLRYLTCRGIFAESAPGMFVHTPGSELLRRDDPSRWNEWLVLGGMAARLDRTATEGLLPSVRTGKPSYSALFECPMWTQLAADPALAETFDGLMRSLNHRWVSGVLEHDWRGVRRVVDVGGGMGGLLAELLEEWPHLTGTLVDLGVNASAAGKIFARRRIDDRADAVAGSFFEPLPGHGDVYLLAHVLHDWDDEHAERILRRCGEAAGPEGRVLVVERAIDAAENAHETTVKDLRMLTLLGGRERDPASFRRLAGNVGLAERRVRPIQAGHCLLEYEPV